MRHLLCLHCRRNKQYTQRGLCQRCTHDPKVRRRYPSASKYAPGDHEPAEEELEKLIAHQMRHLPPWWERAVKEQERGG